MDGKRRNYVFGNIQYSISEAGAILRFRNYNRQISPHPTVQPRFSSKCKESESVSALLAPASIKNQPKKERKQTDKNTEQEANIGINLLVWLWVHIVPSSQEP